MSKSAIVCAPDASLNATEDADKRFLSQMLPSRPTSLLHGWQHNGDPYHHNDSPGSDVERSRRYDFALFEGEAAMQEEHRLLLFPDYKEEVMRSSLKH